MTRFSDQATGPDPAKLRRLYELMERVADPDSLHDLIVRHGVDILEQPIPYLVRAARNQQTSNWRRARTNREATELSDDAVASFWDPADQALANDELRRLLALLAEQDNRDVLVLWRHVQGATDSQILTEWAALGFEPGDMSEDGIRQRRSRVRKGLRRRLAE